MRNQHFLRRPRLRPRRKLEQPKVHLADNVEMTTDGRLLWYETIDEDSRGWHVFDMTTGKVRGAGEDQIAQLRDQYSGGFIGVPLITPRPR